MMAVKNGFEKSSYSAVDVVLTFTFCCSFSIRLKMVKEVEVMLTSGIMNRLRRNHGRKAPYGRRREFDLLAIACFCCLLLLAVCCKLSYCLLDM
ncbi:hypothetical protein K402DRAFT_24898 [Aulographum hederae CBS 113979]|uniref:Transmembrane protein n=1 Tax=Aulographum hederae CBS 113979 TaxID=1176131 RepID=A0A6G1H5Q0_9PEZI|nr:hypothetical protein K402DRAFT_24898 [Aulographum hederae CBS 113979]